MKNFTHTQTVVAPSFDLLSLTCDDVSKSYTGRSGRCRCGCAGNYRESGPGVTRTLNALKHQHGLFPVSITVGLFGDVIVDAQIGDRDYTLYCGE